MFCDTWKTASVLGSTELGERGRKSSGGAVKDFCLLEVMYSALSPPHHIAKVFVRKNSYRRMIQNILQSKKRYICHVFVNT